MTDREKQRLNTQKLMVSSVGKKVLQQTPSASRAQWQGDKTSEEKKNDPGGDKSNNTVAPNA